MTNVAVNEVSLSEYAPIVGEKKIGEIRALAANLAEKKYLSHKLHVIRRRSG